MGKLRLFMRMTPNGKLCVVIIEKIEIIKGQENAKASNTCDKNG
jgi:hypothetical protein